MFLFCLLLLFDCFWDVCVWKLSCWDVWNEWRFLKLKFILLLFLVWISKFLFFLFDVVIVFKDESVIVFGCWWLNMLVFRLFIFVLMRLWFFVIFCLIFLFIKLVRFFLVIVNLWFMFFFVWLNKLLSFLLLVLLFVVFLMMLFMNLSMFLVIFLKLNKLFDLFLMFFFLVFCGFWLFMINVWLRLLFIICKLMLVWLLEIDIDVVCCLENLVVCCNLFCCNCFFNILFGWIDVFWFVFWLIFWLFIKVLIWFMFIIWFLLFLILLLVKN